MITFVKKYSLKIFSVLSLLISFFIFWKIINENIATDIQSHSLYIVNYVKAGAFLIPPLYYFCVFALSGFSLDVDILNNVAIYLLTFCFFLKYLYSCHLTKGNYILEQNKISSVEKNTLIFFVLFAAPLVQSFSQEYLLLGKLASNVWHNSTTTAVMPFVVLLFYQSLKFIKDPQISYTNIFYILLFGLINLLIKPSFLFAFIPAFSLILLISEGFKSRKFWVGVSIAFSIFILIIVEYYIIYEVDFYHQVYNQPKTNIIVKPFYILALFNQNVLTAIYLSLLFPITCVIFFEKEIKSNISLQYTLLLFLFAFIIGVLFIEEGARAGHGNFTWQIIFVNYIVFLVFALLAYERIKYLGYLHYKSIILIVVFIWHILSGWLYIYRIVETKSYF